MKKNLTLWAGIFLLLAFTMPLNAQQFAGSISGVVQDQSGAMVAGAEVTVTNEGTGAKRVVKSDDTGFYTVPQLLVATYTVSVAMQGFQTAVHTGVDLHVREDKTLNITLKVGAVAQQVTVEGGATAVELRSGEVANLISSTQTTELPLNGRSFVQLTLLVPGASIGNTANVRNTGLLSSVDISVSGSPSNANMWLVDGANNVDIGSGRTILVYPSVDSIEEFKIQRNSYGPDMGASGGAQINLVTKSGTNALHGVAYDFLRNDAFNAVNYFINSVPRDANGNRVSAVPKLRYNDFGYAVGGPVKRDKVFFYWSQEWRREKRGDARNELVPSMEERQGIFTDSRLSNFQPKPINPWTGETMDFIPDNMLSPAGLAVMKLYPPPTYFDSGRGWVWLEAPTTPITTRQEQIRADWNVRPGMTVMGRYTQDAWTNFAPNYGYHGGLWGDDPYPQVDSDWSQPSKSLAIQVTNTIGGSMVNQFQFSYSNNRIIITRGPGDDINDAITAAIPEVWPGPEGRPHLITWGSPVGQSLWRIAPWNNAQDLYVWKDDFSKVHGNHSFKFGALVSRNSKNEDGDNVPVGQVWGPYAVPGGGGWNGLDHNGDGVAEPFEGGGWGDANAPGYQWYVTGNNLADFLLKGTYWGYSEQDIVTRANTRWRDFELYFRDTWRLHPRLTLDYGLRWSYLPNPFDGMDKIGNWVPTLYDPARGSAYDNGMIYPGDTKGLDVNSRSLVRNHWTNIGPRVGIAWDPTGQGKWAIRAGGGLFYNREAISDVLIMTLNPPFAHTANFGVGRPLDDCGGVSCESWQTAAGTGTPLRGKSIDGDTPGSYQWNFTIERELMRDTKLEVAYVGNRGHHLPLAYMLNQVPSGDVNGIVNGTFVAAPDGVPDRVNFARCTLNIETADCDEHQFRRLYALKADSDSLQWYSREGNSSYHAFQVYVNKRYSRNFSYQVSYSLSKVLGTSNLGYLTENYVSDYENAKYDRGLAVFDRTHILTVNTIYRLPEFRNWHWAARGLVGDWELSNIYSYSTGVPITIDITGQNATGTNSLGGHGIRPDLVGYPYWGSNKPDKTYRLNPTAFAVPAELGRLGRSPRGVARQPAINNWDFAIFKNFPLSNVREGMAIQFRAEFFNVLNHTQFILPDESLDFDIGGLRADPATNRITGCTVGGVMTSNLQACNTNTNFGRATRAREGREIQFALKFIF